MEDHWDDLGDDLSGLGPDVTLLSHDWDPAVCDTTDESEQSAEEFLGSLQWAGLSDTTETTNRIEVSSMDEALALLASVGPGIDVMELCGGDDSRVIRIGIRRRLKVGQNFDLALGIDLGDHKEQAKVLQYIYDNDVLVVSMAPSCRTVGPPSNVNASINFDTWASHRQEDLPHLQFCGAIALIQLDHNRDFFAEQPYPSYLWDIDPWPRVMKHPRVQRCILDQCMVGQAIENPTKKPTEVVASSPELLEPFEDLRCDKSHAHASTWGRGKALQDLQRWTWDFAGRLVEGIIRLKRRLASRKHSEEALWHGSLVSGCRPCADPLASDYQSEALDCPVNPFSTSAIGETPGPPWGRKTANL